MPIVYSDWITRKMLRAKPDALFVFGDNAERKGFGGQAREMRDEPNAIGIATKWAPGMAEKDFFSETTAADLARALDVMGVDLEKIRRALLQGKTVIVPSAGLGTGLSQLPTRAPTIYRELWRFFNDNSIDGCHWPKP